MKKHKKFQFVVGLDLETNKYYIQLHRHTKHGTFRIDSRYRVEEGRQTYLSLGFQNKDELVKGLIDLIDGALPEVFRNAHRTFKKRKVS